MAGPYYSPEIETASLDRIQALQSERLRHMVKRCYENVPFYKDKLDACGIKPEDIQSVEDLSKLPFTLKSDLRDHYPYGLFAVPKEELVRIHASSGTTGKKTVVGYTKNDINDWSTDVARALVAAGAGREDYIHISFGYGLFTGGFGLHYGAEYLGATAIPVSSGNTKKQIEILQDFGSNVLCCTPSYALYIGETMRDMGVDPASLHLRTGVFGAEPWTENMRKQIESLLHIKAYDIYGLSEIMGPGVSYECEEQSGMHINEDQFIAEIIDPDTGKVLPLGSRGELVFTCIAKEALPLIRYRTRDITRLTRDTCSCGRRFIKMKKVFGRSDDMLIIRGVNVFPSQVESVLLEMGLVSPHYLLIVDRVDNADTLEIQVEMSNEMFSDEIRVIEDTQRLISQAVQSALGISANIKLVEPKSIGRSEGKAKRVIDKRML